ncbi:MAG: DUF192 domain-containing protein [Candidatus Diapherotrites archaeon]
MLENKTKKSKILDKTRIADSHWKKFKGLMLESKKNFDYALIFEFAEQGTLINAIHMLFVFFPIDAIYLDENKKAVDIKRNLKPWTLYYAPKKPAKYLIELPEEKGKEIELNDELNW